MPWIRVIDEENATGDLNAFAIPAFQQLQWHFNTRRNPLNDLKVRQALAYTYPYKTTAQGTFGGLAVPAKGAVPRVQWKSSFARRVRMRKNLNERPTSTAPGSPIPLSPAAAALSMM